MKLTKAYKIAGAWPTKTYHTSIAFDKRWEGKVKPKIEKHGSLGNYIRHLVEKDIYPKI